MNKIIKLIIITLSVILAISIFSPNAKCITTIGNSTLQADEGDVYTWEMTYCHPALNASLGIGSYMNLTIEDIGQGPYLSITHALLVNATIGYFHLNPNSHLTFYRENYFAYNATLHYFNSLYFACLIIPTPLNLTMISDFLETHGYTCTIAGNTIIAENISDEVLKIKYNSTGHMISYSFSEAGVLGFVYGPNESGGDSISFGYYFLISTIVGTLALIYIEKKKIK